MEVNTNLLGNSGSNSKHHAVPSELKPLLVKAGIALDKINRFEALTGGVSSEVWLLESEGRQFCVKRALCKLKVKQDWQVAVNRSEFEVLWFQTVSNLLGNFPLLVPKILASDERQHAFVMSYFEPEVFPLWKQQLAQGNINIKSAIKVAQVLGRIHQYTARLPELVQRFNNRDVFYQIRIEPYFLASARKHPQVAQHINLLAEQLAATQMCLVHGDISPKNILIGEQSPIFLDAECAIYGDPAFDIAFLLNHLLLKSFMVFEHGTEKVSLLCEAFSKVLETYCAYVDWEDAQIFRVRALDYLAVFLLARIDGKSPIEYVNAEADKNFVRQFALNILNKKISMFEEIPVCWQKAFIQHKQNSVR